MNRGWIRLYRKISDNKLWVSEPFTRGQAWVDMLLLANHKDGFIYVRGNRVSILRGQVGWSIIKIAERWRWSRGKVIRFLNELEVDQQIVQQKNHLSSVFTIINYTEYQENGTQTEQQTVQQTGHRRATDVLQTDTNKNDKKEKNVKKEDKEGSPKKGYSQDFDLFWNAYPKRNDKRIGKGDTFKRWEQVKPDDREKVMKAVKHYAESGTIPKDPVRFFRLDSVGVPYWHEWLEPATPDEPSKHDPQAGEKADMVKRQIRHLEEAIARDRHSLTFCEDGDPNIKRYEADIARDEREIAKLRGEG